MTTRFGLVTLLAVLCAGCGADQFARVRVETNPPTAEVWIGKMKTDTSPCQLLFDSPGDFEVFVKKAGYETVLKRVKVVENETETDTLLEALPAEMIVTLDPVEEDAGGETDTSTPVPYYDE
jgi:hypothetical protein